VRLVRLLTLAPGRPAAARLHAAEVDGVRPGGHVYAPLAADLLAHLGRLPAGGAADVRAGPDWRDRAFREQPGNTAVVAGRADLAPGLVLDAVRAGLHVLADGPWANSPADLPYLAHVAREAELRELVVWPLDPLRHDPAVRLLAELVADPDAFGGFHPGTPDDPGLALDLTRRLDPGQPAWAFDPVAGGGAFAAALPLADLAVRLAVPDRVPDPARDLGPADALTWPTVIDRPRFAELTGLPDFPPGLAGAVQGGTLTYPANVTLTATVNGLAVRIGVQTDPDPGPGDAVEVVARGRRATLTARPGEIDAVPADREGGLFAALARRCQVLQARFPGLSVLDLGGRYRLPVPPAADPFARLLAEFVRHFRNPAQVPPAEPAATRVAQHLIRGAGVRE
jgi:hypothetical protein